MMYALDGPIMVSFLGRFTQVPDGAISPYPATVPSPTRSSASGPTRSRCGSAFRSRRCQLRLHDLADCLAIEAAGDLGGDRLHDGTD